ncbi:aryl-sulfate sulfotransferase [Chloroflexota bacterium]
MGTYIDQQTRRRIMRTGLTAHDTNLACPGYVLFGPKFGRSIHLIDVEGKEVHRWELDYISGEYGYLLPSSNLFFMGKDPDMTEVLFPAWPIVRGGIMQEVDINNKVVWEYRDPYMHHDARRTGSGGVIYLAIERLSSEVARKFRGGGRDRPMWADFIIEVDKDGNRIWEWHASEHLDPAVDRPRGTGAGFELTHCNTIVVLDDNHIMIGSAALSLIAIIQKSSGDIIWRVGSETLSGQHDCNPLPNGNVLVYCNTGRADQRIGGIRGSSVIEIDRQTKEVIWEYADTPRYNFYSPIISGARRLPNGNTLITEGVFGRMFQVTPGKEVVWEYINPYFFPNHRGVEMNEVFRAIHYTKEELPFL